MTKPPLVSIAIPAYNHAKFIEACLASVCAQTYAELELVLIDDGSVDGTFEIAQLYLERHRNRFRRIVLEQRKNQGVSANSNACIESCEGEWVHLIGSDDVLYPNKVDSIQQFIASCDCDSLALVHADCDYIDQLGLPTKRSKLKSRPDPGVDFKAYTWLFLGEHYIFNPTIALHRQTFLASGGFDQALQLEDLDCWLRLSTVNAIARVPEVLASYRKHPGNASRRRIEMLSAHFKTYAKFLERNPGSIGEAALRQHFRRNVWRYWRRIRKMKPWVLPAVLAEILQSYWGHPDALGYQRYATLLDRVSHQ